jgi:GT2 family glycosyltransferase
MKIAAVVVHYHAGDLARRALAEIRRQADADGRSCDLLIVDHGGDDADRAHLEAAARESGARRVMADNAGYAAGVNRGVAELAADAVLFLNPDVLLFDGALRSLVAAVEGGAGVAGPRFHWDADRRFLLPPTERRGRWPALLDALGQRSERWAVLARRRWRAHARRHWRAAATIRSHDLSGGCLLVSRSAWDRVGPFDERFRLYFEENDWLLRARRLGVPGAYVAHAAALHEVGRSSASEARASVWFEESARLFRRLHYGPNWAALVERIAARGVHPRGASQIRALTPFRLPAASAGGWVEVSPNAVGYPAAGEFVAPPREGHGEAPWRLPSRVREAVASEGWSLRWVSEGGVEGPACAPP